MPDIKWTPDEYLDEICPPPRDDPSDWIVGRDGDRWRLADIDGEDDGRADWRITCVEGETVGFSSIEEFGTYLVEIGADGAWSCDHEIPEATHYCAPGDIDTLADSMDEFARNMAADFAGEMVEVSAYTWSDSVPHRLVVEDGKARFKAMAKASLQ